jgi:hypothetical protein
MGREKQGAQLLMTLIDAGDRSEWSSGESGAEDLDLDLEGGESYFSYTSILFNQGDIQADSRPAATMMHSLYSDNPLHAAPSQRSKSMGSSLTLPLSLSVRPDHGYKALRGDDRDRERDSLPIPELRRGTSGSGSGGGGGDLAAALGSINRNMIELSELGILDLGPNGAAGMLYVVLAEARGPVIRLVQCNPSLSCDVLCCTVLHCTVLYCTVLCCAELCCSVLCCAVLCCAVM